MSDTNDKENIGSQGSSKSYQSLKEDSPTNSKKMLSPISLNRNYSLAGKTNSVDNDSLDHHFSVVHSFHEDIQGQLHNLEYHTKQMGVDLGQLCDRSKNNNQYLTRLLDNITRYSEEVITDGNATKQDITAVQNKLKEIQDAFEKIDLDRVNEIIDTQVLKLEKSFGGERKQENNRLRNEILSIVEKGSKDLEIIWDERLSEGNGLFAMIDRGLKSNSVLGEKLIARIDEMKTSLPPIDVTEQILNPLLEKMKNISFDEDSQRLLEDLLKSFEVANDTYQKQNFSPTVVEAVNNLAPTIEELKASLNTLKGGVDDKVYKQLQESLNKLEEHAHTQNLHMQHMTESMNSQKEVLDSVIEKAKLQDTKYELEQKITSLEIKYNQLKDSYIQKYDEFKNLKKEYEELDVQVGSMGEVSDEKIKKLSKFRELQAFNATPLDTRAEQIKAMKKRVMSTPTKHEAYETPFTIYNDFTNTTNNSDSENP